jgi:uncharacterized membrane protein (GlpM family)
MAQYVVGIALIAIVYICLGIIILAPTIYLAWFYVVSRKIRGVGKVSLRSLILTFIANAIIGYFIFFLIHNWLYVPSVTSNDTIAREMMDKTIAAQNVFYEKHGRYYEVGPVRGPYSGPNGLKLEKNVIVEVTRKWDKSRNKESFQAYGIHLWGDKLYTGDPKGISEEVYADSTQAASIRSRLIESTR